jgi:hypothetical protein
MYCIQLCTFSDRLKLHLLLSTTLWKALKLDIITWRPSYIQVWYRIVFLIKYYWTNLFDKTFNPIPLNLLLPICPTTIITLVLIVFAQMMTALIKTYLKDKF